MSSELDSYVTNAIEWVKERLGSKEYPFLCLAFVEDAYERSSQKVIHAWGIVRGTGIDKAGRL